MSDIEKTPETYWSFGEHVPYGALQLHEVKMIREIAVQLKRIADMIEKEIEDK